MAMCEGQRLMMSFRTPCSCLTVIALHSSGMRSRNSFPLVSCAGTLATRIAFAGCLFSTIGNHQK